MNKSVFTLFTAVAVVLPTGALAQEAAGRVLAAAGTVTIQRDGQQIAARPGTEVRSGDQIQLAQGSNAQVRFSDDSLVALGSQTTLRVSEYRYQNTQPGQQRAFLELLQGGMRTVTGLIGKLNRADYRLTTPTSTIGIRGTAFAACHECTTPGGQRLQGTIVGFTEGAGTMRTQAGELALTAGQSAQATAPNAAPQRTLSMPQTQQQAQARPTPAQQQQAQSQSGQAAGATTSTSTAAASPIVMASSAPVMATTANTATSVSATTTATESPTFQVTTSGTPTSLLLPTSSGTLLYRLAGPFNILATGCLGGTCQRAVDGQFVLGINYSLGRAAFKADFKLSNGELYNAGIPIALSGIPITVNGSTATFSGTFKLVDFPDNQGAFRCGDCGANNTPGFFDSITLSGTVSGSTATVTFSGQSTNSAGTLTATLPLATPPNNSAGAISTPTAAGSRDNRSYAYWDVTLDSSGRLTAFGPNAGGPAGTVGNATNTIVGSAPTAGNLVWGTWTTVSGSTTTILDSAYGTPTLTSGTILPWITGDAANTLPPSLGTLSFTPIASVFSGTTQLLNSASLTADFVNRSLSLNISATNTRGQTLTSLQNAFTMSATTGFSPINGRFSAGFNNVTCSGICNNGTGTLSGSFGGFFAGSQAQGAGVAFSAGYGSSAQPGNPSTGAGVTGVIGFKR